MSKPSNASKIYVFTPTCKSLQGIIYIMIPPIFGMVGLIGNVLVLHIISKSNFRTSSSQRAFDRIFLLKYFVASLAISDVICSGIISLMMTLQMFIDIRQDVWNCRLARFLYYSFPFVTINNLLVIAVERYFAIFRPFCIPKAKVIRFVVIVAWICGIAVSASLLTTVELVRYDINSDQYTFACKHTANNRAWKKALFVSVFLFQYCIPNFIFLYISAKITRFLQQRRKRKNFRCFNSTQCLRYKGTQMFIKIILAFSLPYSVFFCYGISRVVFKFELDFSNDTRIRFISALLSLLNSSVNPFIYSLGSPFFKREFMKIFRALFCQYCKVKKTPGVVNGTRPTCVKLRPTIILTKVTELN